MKKSIRIILIVVLLPVLIYRFGPRPEKVVLDQQLPEINSSLSQLDSLVSANESHYRIKPDNESRIIWSNDTVRQQTEYCLLYLHGFSASWYEGYPTHQNFGKHFGMNIYIPRMADHGLITDDPLLHMTPAALYETAKQALVIARKLGQKVILMGTSTGGTLALKLAADFPELVNGLILLSPNIQINNPKAFLLSGPWGLQIARMAYKSDYRVTNEDFTCKECQYWNCKYRLEATVFLQQLVEETMNKETFEKVKAPLFLGYYYKDENHQDEVVRVDAMLKMFDQTGTPETKKYKQAFPEARAHVIGGELFSGSQPEVEKACIDFAIKQLQLP